jgi:hypothetical protein
MLPLADILEEVFLGVRDKQNLFKSKENILGSALTVEKKGQCAYVEGTGEASFPDLVLPTSVVMVVVRSRHRWTLP